MGKFGTYIIIMSGLILLFYVTGLLPETANSVLLNFLLDPSAFQDSNLSIKAIVVMQGILASAIVVGFAAVGNIELGVMVAFSIELFNVLWDFMAIITVVLAINPVLGLLVFSPLMFLFVVTMLEWWRGVTT